MSVRTQFYHVFRDFLVWYSSLFEQDVNKIVNFCFQYRENLSNTMILFVSYNFVTLK